LLPGPVGVDERLRVDPEVAGVRADEALGIDVAAQLIEALAFERLEIARPDSSRGGGFLDGPPLRFSRRAELLADVAQAGTPLQ
jgi:hypothetical protein